MGGCGRRCYIVSIVSAHSSNKDRGLWLYAGVCIIYRNLFWFKKNPESLPTWVINGYEEEQHCTLSLHCHAPPPPWGHLMMNFLKNNVYSFPNSICSKGLYPNLALEIHCLAGTVCHPVPNFPEQAVLLQVKGKCLLGTADNQTSSLMNSSKWNVSPGKGGHRYNASWLWFGPVFSPAVPIYFLVWNSKLTMSQLPLRGGLHCPHGGEEGLWVAHSCLEKGRNFMEE